MIKAKKDEESDRSVGSVSVSDGSHSSSLSEGELESDDKLLLKMQQSASVSNNIEGTAIGEISLLSKETLPFEAGTSISGENFTVISIHRQ